MSGLKRPKLDASALNIYCEALEKELANKIIDEADYFETKQENQQLKDASNEVMNLLEEHGGSIVPHLLDSDDNAGERLRQLTQKTKPKK